MLLTLTNLSLVYCCEVYHNACLFMGFSFLHLFVSAFRYANFDRIKDRLLFSIGRLKCIDVLHLLIKNKNKKKMITG